MPDPIQAQSVEPLRLLLYNDNAEISDEMIELMAARGVVAIKVADVSDVRLIATETWPLSGEVMLGCATRALARAAHDGASGYPFKVFGEEVLAALKGQDHA